MFSSAFSAIVLAAVLSPAAAYATYRLAREFGPMARASRRAARKMAIARTAAEVELMARTTGWSIRHRHVSRRGSHYLWIARGHVHRWTVRIADHPVPRGHRRPAVQFLLDSPRPRFDWPLVRALFRYPVRFPLTVFRPRRR